MKKLYPLCLLMFLPILSYAQIKYTIYKIAYATVTTDGSLDVGAFTQVPQTYLVLLYNDALVFDDKANTFYKFGRKIGMEDRQRWNAVDKAGKACEVTIKDYGNYTLIAIKYFNSNKVTVYQTL